MIRGKNRWQVRWWTYGVVHEEMDLWNISAGNSGEGSPNHRAVRVFLGCSQAKRWMGLSWHGEGCGGFYRQSCGGRKYKAMFFEDIYIYAYIYIHYIYIYTHRYYRPTYLQKHFFVYLVKMMSIAIISWGHPEHITGISRLLLNIS